MSAANDHVDASVDSTAKDAAPSSGKPVSGRRSRLAMLFATPVGIAAITADLLVILLAVFGPIIWGTRAETNDFDNLDSGPISGHPFGTDKLGRDILARVLVAARLSIGLALSATLIGIVVGVLIGTMANLAGRRLSRVFSTFIGIAVAFPGLLLALFFAVIFGAGPTGAVLALGAAMAPGFARLTQTLSASVVGRDFVSAAKVLGVSRLRVLTRHVVPNIAEPLIVNATLAAGSCLLAFAGLSFLGLGVQLPSYDWGRMLAEGLNAIYTNPMAALGPALAIVLSGLAFNLTGELGAQLAGRRTTRGRRRQRGAADGSDDQRAPGAGGLPAAADTPSSDAVLVVRNLRVSVRTDGGTIEPVRGVDLTVRAGEAVGIVGESGSGKSLTALSIAGLTHEPLEVTADELWFDELDLRSAIGRRGRAQLGTSLSLVFQDPMSSLNPTMRVGDQLAEVATEHQHLSWKNARERAVSRLRDVRIAAPGRRARQLPHEWSGGMRQRAMIGMGLMGEPKLLIADEPTTALDVTVQQQVLELLESTKQQSGAALLLISHDLSVVSSVCDRVVVMYAGRIVEELPTADLEHARHPYTKALLRAVPSMDTPREEPLATIAGRPPDPASLPVGCPFAPRCPRADDRCRVEPALLPVAGRRALGLAACHHPHLDPVSESGVSIVDISKVGAPGIGETR
ncbi:dipeptide/oligopeptide/nickel ABC transporter permease/ATP-binding protein [Nakamurella lactea]|uniref:dipeptide/oligopeptide/nickel ABC transporter permease/ATP-binding protein n=1 Tax=Nakamurella lactea TaxID=459515 RepID=UPI000407B7D8|nr:dipeptide/oligopeptide/nickel ABC transporter permease/ATP-binding protein [Nakamurella lactea]